MPSRNNRLGLLVLVAFAGVSFPGCNEVEQPAVAFSPGTEAGANAPLTVVLPADWTYAPGEQGSERIQKFVFSGPGKAYPYLWVQVEKCSPSEVVERRTKAADVSSRSFLSGGDLTTDYYDSGRKLRWSRIKDQFGNANVTATIYDKQITTLKFFDERSHLDEFEPTIAAIVDNIQLHDPEENVVAANEPVELPSGISAKVFADAAEPAGFPYLLLIFTIVVVGVLARIEYAMREKRNAAQVAEVVRKQQLRKEQEAATKRSQNSAAAAYIRDMPHTNRRNT
ncbi:MAG: hypothetical protein AB7O26_00360 [Planctomycetaceae bacterium]